MHARLPSTWHPAVTGFLLLVPIWDVSGGELPFLRYRTWLCPPDLTSVFRNSPVAGELSRAGYVQNCSTCPFVRFGVQGANRLLHLYIRGEVRQMHVAVAVRQKSVA